MRTERLSDAMNYPPRAFRAERAAAYLGISEATFLRLVDAGELPQPVRKRGIVSWDRFELDAAYENWKDAGKRSDLTVQEVLSDRRAAKQNNGP
jgi:predicted DNA-binding transcriptional regulator AlpA